MAAWERAAELSGREVRFIMSALGYGYGLLGQPERAREILRELEVEWSDAEITYMERAKVLAGLGDTEGALALLERAYSGSEPWIIGLKIDSGFEPLHGLPEFDSLLRRLGVEPP